MAIEYGPLQVAEGRYTKDLDPGIAATVAAVNGGLAATNAANAQSQRDALAFIEQNGAQVLNGHAPVNSPTGSFLEPGDAPVFDAGID